VSGSHDRTLKVWDLRAGTLRATFEGLSDPVWTVAVTVDGPTTDVFFEQRHVPGREAAWTSRARLSSA